VIATKGLILPDYSKYTLEELIEAKNSLNLEQYPERGKELEQLITQMQLQPSGVYAATKEIIWLKRPASEAPQKFWLYASLAIIFLLPIFFIGEYAPNYSSLYSYDGVYKGIRQTYNRNGVELYNLQVDDRTFQVAGTWAKLLSLEPGTNLSLMSFSGNRVWEIRSKELPVVSYSDFVQYSEKRKSDKKTQAFIFFIVAVFGFAIFFKMKKHNNKLLVLK
tara:strand:+ start:4682 stop:5341 length:660 start_codon:yes stop_codon:yes gene_type:complete